MWDLPPFEVRDGQIHSRACDDLIGCAEIICVFRELEERGANAHCVGLFTRAEEVGFVGAITAREGGDSAAQPDDFVARDEHAARHGRDRQRPDRAGGGQGLDF